MNQLVTTTENRQVSTAGAFSNVDAFENAQRMAKALSQSDLVPTQYKGPNGVANCLVALEVAQRTGSSIMAVCQNLHVIHGRPSWSASYIIAALNSCGRFTPLRFVMSGEGDKRQCIAQTTDKETKDVLEGPPVTIAMAKAEGWFQKTGSKWQTMPDLMLRYRAAAFFGRLYAPDVLMGMQSEDEIRDVTETHSTATDSASKLNDKILKTKAKRTAQPEAKPVDAEIIEPDTVKPKGESEALNTTEGQEFF